MRCGEKWDVVNELGSGRESKMSICDSCAVVVVPSREVFDELLRRYRALAGSDPTVDYESIANSLRQGRVSRYTTWKRENRIKTVSDAEEDEDEAEEEEESEEDEEPPSVSKRAAERAEEAGPPAAKRQATEQGE